MEKVEFFKEMGFSEYESKAITGMIRIVKGNAKEISLESGVPQNKLYGILRNFEKRGIISTLPDKKYQLINIKTFINERLKEKENALKKLKQGSKVISDLRDSETSASFSLIKGQLSIMNKIAEENEKVEKEILGVQRNWKVWGKGLRAMENAVKRGVIVKQIGIINEETTKRAEEWKKTGIQIKKYNSKFGEYPLRFSIFDNKTARITIGKPEIQKPEDYITIWTDSRALILMLRNQFFEMWKECERY